MTRKRNSETSHSLASKYATLRVYPDRGKPAVKPKPEMDGQMALFSEQECSPEPPADDPGDAPGRQHKHKERRESDERTDHLRN